MNRNYPTGNYMFKVNNKNTRKRSEMCSKLTIKMPGVVLVSSLLTLSIFQNLEQVNAGWDIVKLSDSYYYMDMCNIYIVIIIYIFYK